MKPDQFGPVRMISISLSNFMFRVFSALVLLGAASVLHAQRSPVAQPKIILGVHGQIKATGAYTLAVNEVGVNGSTILTQTYTNFAGATTRVPTADHFLSLVAGKLYRIDVTGAVGADLQFNVPPGCTARMGAVGVARTARTTCRLLDSTDIAGSSIELAVESADGAAMLRPGYANAPSAGKTGVLWAIGVGTNRAGRGVGSLRWSGTAVTAQLLDASSLVYNEPYDSDVYVYRDTTGQIRTVSTWGVQIVVRPGSTPNTGYSVECYAPGATQTPNTGFRQYVVSNPDSTWNKRVRIDVTTRSSGQSPVSDTWIISEVTTSFGSVVRIEQGNAARRLNLISKPGPGTDERTEIAALDSGPSTAIVSRSRRVYKTLFKGTLAEREELIQDIADPSEYFDDTGMGQTSSSALNWITSYTYYEDSSKTGSFAKLNSVTRPDGSWEVYRYFGDASNDPVDASKWGLLSAVYRPWLDNDGVSAATANENNCRAQLTDFVPDRNVYAELLSRSETKTMGVRSALTTTEYSADAVWQRFPFPTNAPQPIRVETTKSYSANGEYLVTVRKVFAANAVPFAAGRVYSQLNPDGTLISTAYLTYGGGYDWIMEESMVGHASNPGNGAILNYNSLFSSNIGSLVNFQMVEPVWLTPGKSTVRRVVRDMAGRVFSDGSAAYLGGPSSMPWIELKISSYSATGELIETGTGKGERWTGTYTNGRLASETKPDGSVVENTYDTFGRLIRTKVKVTGQPDVTTENTYDSADRVVSVRRVSGSLELSTSTTYNLAGLPISSMDERGLTTTMTYADGGRTLTKTLPGGAYVTEQHYRDGSSKITHGTAGEMSYENSVRNGDGSITRTRYILRASDLAAIQGASPSSLAGVLDVIPRWSSIKTDWLGRKLVESRPAATGGTFTKTYFYNSTGKLIKATEPNIAATLYTYNVFGEAEITGLDSNGSDSLTLNSTDRVQKAQNNFQMWSQGDPNSGGTVNQQTLTYGYTQNGDANPTLMGRSQVELAALEWSPNAGTVLVSPATGLTQATTRTITHDLFGNVTIATHIVNRGTATVTDRKSVVGISGVEEVISRGGLVTSRKSAQGLITTYSYDGLRRPVTENQPRVGTAKTAYYTRAAAAAGTYAVLTTAPGADGQVAWREDAAGNRTSYTYHATDGRLFSETNPQGQATYYAYNDRGQIIRQWGPATYPVEYEYNDFGEKTKMRTFRDTTAGFATAANWGLPATTPYPSPSTSGDTTTWVYHGPTGLLLSKTDADSKTVTYTYDIRGNLKTRTWARGVVTTYSYSSLTGEQISVTYSDTTPGLTYDYNRLGQNTSIVQGTGGSALTTLYLRCICGKITRETFDPTFFGGQILSYKLDSTGNGTRGRTIGYQLGVADSYALNGDYAYGYDSYGRFSTLSLPDENITYTYNYLANSNLISTLNEADYTQSFTYESNRDHVSRIETLTSARVLAGVSYAVDSLGRRTSAVHDGDLFARYSGGGHHTAYGYNDRSEVTSAQTWTGLDLNDTSSTSALAGRKFDFAFDPIGNRVTSKVDNRQSGYTTNALNQYTSRSTPRATDVTGLASGPGTVTVSASVGNSASGTVAVSPTTANRLGDYYASTLTASSNNAFWLSAMVAANPGGTQTRNAWLPATPEAYSYDLDGNLTDDGRWHYTWDAENRLTSMETIIDAYTLGAPRHYLTFKYDHQGRRIRKTVASWNGTTYVADVDRKFIYDGWNLIAEYDVLTTFTLARTYVWGLDISRTLVDAGGVHGLLMIRDWATGQSHQTIYDGNGNLLGLINRRTGEITAQYEYSPFGETLRATGSYSASNPFRFSTKYTDSETGLVYYGRRYYNPCQGRFLGRDPKSEAGGLHLYAFVRNSPISRWDLLGMQGVDTSIMMAPVSNKPTKIERKEGDDGCIYDYYYSNEADAAYGFEDWMEIGRVKISCPQASPSDESGAGISSNRVVSNSNPAKPKNGKMGDQDCAGLKAALSKMDFAKIAAHPENYGGSSITLAAVTAAYIDFKLAPYDAGNGLTGQITGGESGGVVLSGGGATLVSRMVTAVSELPVQADEPSTWGFNGPIPGGSALSAYYHLHPSGSYTFSGSDLRFSNANNVAGFLAIGNGDLYRYDPNLLSALPVGALKNDLQGIINESIRTRTNLTTGEMQRFIDAGVIEGCAGLLK